MAGTPAAISRETIRGYAVPGFVLSSEIMSSHGNGTAFAQAGQIYISDALTTEMQVAAPMHELVHTMKQLEFDPYGQFVVAAWGQLRPGNTLDAMLASVMRHRNIPGGPTELGDLSLETQRDILDEFNATLYGSYVRDAEVVRAHFGVAFEDLDSYVANIENLLNQFKDRDTSKDRRFSVDSFDGGIDQDRVREIAATPEFQQWFHDDIGELTNEDGTPKVILRGDAHSGATKFYSGDEARSRGIFFSQNMDTARIYGARDLPEAAKSQVQEFVPRVVESWSEAQEFVTEGLRDNVRLEKDGHRWVLSTRADAGWHEIALYDPTPDGLAEFNADYDADLKSWNEVEDYAKENFTEDYSAEYLPDGVSILEKGEWQEFNSYANTKAGLAKFNAEYGDAVQQNNVVNPGYTQVFLSAQNTLILDAEGRKWNNVDGAGLTTDDYAEQAWADGYDMVIVKNVQDGNAQGQWAFDEYDQYQRQQVPITDYIVRDSSQVKSVHNIGTFDAADPDIRYSVSSKDIFAKQVDSALDEDLSENRYNALYIRDTPNLLGEVGLGDLPLCITARHVQNIVTDKGENSSWHGLPRGIV